MTSRRYRLPPLQFIQGFEAAARTLSFTKAAEELLLTQSAVSRQIKALEDHLGVKLFERRTRELALTPEGERLRRSVVDMLERLQQATSGLGTGGRARPLTVTTTVGLASLWLIPRLPRFLSRHPAADVRVAATNESLNLEQREIDLAIRYFSPDTAPTSAIKLLEEDILPVCSPDLIRDADRPLASPADLSRHTLLHYDYPGARRSFMEWQTWLASFGMDDISPAALHFNQYDQLIRAAVEGQGVALGIQALVGRNLQDGTLIAPFGRSLRTSRAYFIVRSSRLRKDAMADEFVAWLVEEARREGGGETTPNRGHSSNVR
ncbi:MAG: LysR substrate-binding domain-containing protein [Bradyrhizobium sp.]